MGGEEVSGHGWMPFRKVKNRKILEIPAGEGEIFLASGTEDAGDLSGEQLEQNEGHGTDQRGMRSWS